jgi:hypothetical protein
VARGRARTEVRSYECASPLKGRELAQRSGTSLRDGRFCSSRLKP